MRKLILGSAICWLVSAGSALAEDVPAVPPQAPAQHPPPPAWRTVEAPRATQPYPHGEEATDLPTYDGPPCLWASVEYLLWWVKNGPLPTPLVTTGSPASQGVLGSGGSVVFGGSDLDYKAFSGARFTLGVWCDDGHRLGLEGSGFFLERRIANFAAASTVTGAPVLARPFVNAINGTEASEIIASPDQFAGRVAVHSSVSFYGWDANVLGKILPGNDYCVSLLAGFRTVHLEENIGIIQNSDLLAGGSTGFNGTSIVAPASVSLSDQFTTRNEFYGGQLGVRGKFTWGDLFVHLVGKVALGGTHEVGFIQGSSTLSGTGVSPQTVSGGLLAVSSNIGKLTSDEFSVVPELNANIGYAFSPCCRAFVGYSFLYWTDVARPGELINRNVNPTIVPTSQTFGIATGPAQPTSSLHRSDFWAQGVNFGLEMRW